MIVHELVIDALNERNRYLEDKLQAAYKCIHELEKDYNESVLYHMEQQYRRDAEDQAAIDRYRGQD